MKFAKDRRMLIILIMVMATLACTLPFAKKDTTDYVAQAETEALTLGWTVYSNRGVQISLPSTYMLSEIEQDVPGIQSILEMLAGSQAGTSVENLMERFTDDVMMWGTNLDGNLTNPTRILILKNEALAKLPLALISLIDPSKISPKAGIIEETKMVLGGREVLQVTAIQEASAEAIYMLKDSDKLWIISFITTPDRITSSLPDFQRSVSTFRVITVE